MNALEAAHRVLSEAGRPLHFREITQRVLAAGYWKTAGKTPWATLNARISVDIQGGRSAFVRVSPGVYALQEWGLAPATRAAAKPPKKPVKKGASKMTFTQAAEVVLERYANRQPLHYAKITELALQDGLIQTSGQTPQATMYAQILTEISRAEAQGKTLRFTKHGQGLVGLRKWQPTGLPAQIERHNQEVRRQLLERLRQMDSGDFEDLIGELLAEMGFETVEVTSRTNDGGIDVRGVMVVDEAVPIRMAVQVKRWKHNVRQPDVQKVRGSLGTHEHGLIITTSGFAAGARQEAQRADAAPIGLIDGKQLANPMVKHEVRVKRTAYDLIELNWDGDSI